MNQPTKNQQTNKTNNQPKNQPPNKKNEPTNKQTNEPKNLQTNQQKHKKVIQIMSIKHDILQCVFPNQRDLGPGQDWSLAARRRSCNENVDIIPFPIGSMYAIFTL